MFSYQPNPAPHPPYSTHTHTHTHTLAHTHPYSGTLDACGWPGDPNGSPQYFKRQDLFHDDFTNGFDTKNINIALVKGCCKPFPIGDAAPYYFGNGSLYPGMHAGTYGANVGVERADVEYPAGTKKTKNVIRLTAINADNNCCGQCSDCYPSYKQGDPCPLCHKTVPSAGAIQTSDLFASARYDVVAKVPADSGLTWALWTFHYEEHVPSVGKCGDYKCYRDGFKGDLPGFSPKRAWADCCDPECCKTDKSMRKPGTDCPDDHGIAPTTNSTCRCIADYKGKRSPACLLSHDVASCSDDPNKDGLCDKFFNTDLRVTHNCGSGGDDPQFLGNLSLTSWINEINHEIDIEIPANCMGTTVCDEPQLPCQAADGFKHCNQTDRQGTGCIERYHTANLNNYILTTNGGTGNAYSNMCVKVTTDDDGDVTTTSVKGGTSASSASGDEKKKKNEKRYTTTELPTGERGEKSKPFMLVGDGKYHNYTIDWHTGGGDCQARVDFYVDGIFLGSNNVYVPTRASRLLISNWPSQAEDDGGKQMPNWSNWPDNWGGGRPGDGVFYTSHTYISEIKITPYNEPNDIMYPMTFDMPDGCNEQYISKDTCHRHWEDFPGIPAPKA